MSKIIINEYEIVVTFILSGCCSPSPKIRIPITVIGGPNFKYPQENIQKPNNFNPEIYQVTIYFNLDLQG